MESSGFERFSLLTGRAAKSIARLKQVQMEAFHLSGAHVTCLCQLSRQGSLTQGELARRECMDRSQASRILRDLTAQGYVRTEAQQGYKRRYMLTAEGEKTAARIAQIIREINRFVSGSIPQADLDVFYRPLETIARNLEIAAERFSMPLKTPMTEQDETT